jgi:hypothetical protein
MNQSNLRFSAKTCVTPKARELIGAPRDVTRIYNQLGIESTPGVQPANHFENEFQFQRIVFAL